MDSKASSKVISQGHYTIVDLHDGIDGEDAKYITINGLNSFHYTDSNDTTPTPESITLTIIPNNIINYKVKWEYKIASSTGVWNTITSKDGCLIDGLTLKLNDKACFSVLTPITEFRATLTETETNKAYSCTHTISKIHDGDNGQDGNDGNDGQDGQDAYSCILTNESDTILFDQQNIIKPGQIGSSTCKAYSTIIAKKGTQNLDPVSDAITPSTGQYHFKFEPAPVNCTAKKHGDSSFYLDTVSDDKNNGKISITIYLEGKVNKIIKEYTWTKVVDGADAKYLILEGEDKFRYDNPTDTTPTPPTITLTATAFNIPNPTYVWKWFNGSMTQIISGSGATISNNKLTIDDKKLFPNDAKTTKIQCEVAYNGKTYSDTLSVIKTYNGEDGPPGPPGNDAKNIEITGATQIHYNKNNVPMPSSIELTATAKNYTNENYKWYYMKSTGAELIPNQTTNKLLVEHNSIYFNGTDLAQIKVECRENNGTDMSFSQHTITKTHDGEDSSTLVLNIINGTRNVCYNGKEKLITTVITPFAIELFEDDKNVTSSSDVKSITWSCKGHYEVGNANVGAITFKPTPINNYDESKLDTYVSVTINYKGRIIKQSAPITVSKNSTALDWVEEWDGSKVDIDGNYIISPKIFAGKKNNQTNRITGVALGQDIINKNQNIGMAIYYENNLIGRINSDPSVDNNKIIVFGSQPGKQFLVDINGGVIIEGGLKVSASSTTTTIGGIFDTATNAQSSATEASNKAEQAQSTASTAKTQAQQAIDRHDELSSDSKLTALEKLQVEKDFEEIKKEKPSIDNQADVYNISKVNYNNRYNELNNYLYGSSGLLVNMIKTTVIVRDDFKAKFNNYYTERQNILDLVASNSKEHARKYANDLVDNLNIGTENYILNTDFINKENTYTSDGNISVNDGVITVTNANVLKMDLAKSFSATKMSNDIVMAAIATQTSSANVGLNKFIGGNINVYSEDHQYIVDSFKKLKTNMITVPIAITIANATSSNPQIEDWALNRTKAYLDNLKNANLITKDTCLIFEPHPIINGGSTSETEFNPTNKDEFFNNWKKIIVDCMTALNGYKFYGIYIGTNFEKFDSEEQDLVYWDKLCKDLRALYNNHKILYRTNWWTTASWADDLKAKYQAKLDNPLWSKVDIIAIAAYFELNDKKIPTVDELYSDITKGTSIYARGQNIYQEVKNFYDKWKKPVMFGELGCPSKEYGAMNPWSNLTTNVDNEVVQANYFEAYNKAFIYENTELDNSWFLGYSIFTVGTSTTEYDVVDKQAQSIITKGIDFINTNASSHIRCHINDKVTNKTITDFDLPLSQMMNNVQSVTTKLVYDATSTSEIIFNLKPNATFTMSKPILSSGTKASSWTRSSEDIEREIEKANEAAKKAQTDAEKANNRHDELASDSKLTPLEKLQVEKDFEEIKKEKPSIENQANVYSISKTNYTNKYNELNTYLYGGSGILNDMKVTTTITRNDFKTKFNNYYTERQNILDLVASKSKEYADTSIGNIQIGGRNLFKGFKNNEEIRLNDYQNVGGFTQFRENLTFNPADYVDTKFTISLYAKSPNGATELHLYNSNDHPRYFNFFTKLDLNLGNEWKYYTFTFTNIDRGDSYSPSNKIEIYAPNKMGVLVKNIKIDKGNKATDWTPAPEDVQANIDGIQVGGRNLAIGTKSEYVSYNRFTGENDCFTLYRTYLDTLKVGDTITISFTYKWENIVPFDNGVSQARVQGSGNITSWDSGSFPSEIVKRDFKGNGEVDVSYQYTIRADDKKNDYWSPNIRHDNIKSGTVYCKEFKVEKGNKKTDWSPAPEDINEKVDAIESRVSTAEQKITSKAITNTVKEAVDVDGKPIFVQTSVIEQTEKHWNAKFESIGTQNLLINSDFKDEINSKPFGSDYTYLRWDDSAGGTVDLQIWKDDNYWILDGTKAITVVGENFNLTNGECHEHIRAGFDCPKFKVIPGKKYMVSFKFAGHRIDGVTCECLCYDVNGQRLTGSNHAVIIDKVLGGGKDPNNWRTIKHSFTPQEGADFCCIRIFINKANIDTNSGGSNSCFLWVLQPMVNQGSVYLDWTSHTSEYYMGSVDMTKDGVKVSMADGQGAQGYTMVSHEGLGVYNASGQRKAWFGESDSAFIDRIETRHIEAPNVVKKYVNEINLYVGPTQLGNGSGSNWSNRIGGISNAIQIIRRDYGEYIHGYVNIYVADGEYYENMWVEGIYGTGDFTFFLSMETYVVGQWVIVNMGKIVKIKGGRGGEDINNGARLVCDLKANDAAHISVRYAHLELDTVRAYNRDAGSNRYRGYFVSVADGATALIWVSDFSRYSYGMLTLNSSRGSIIRCRGYCQYPAASRYGSHVTLDGYPKTKENSWSDYGGEIHTWGVAKESLYDPNYEAAPPPTPPTPTYKWVEQNFSLSNLRTVPEGSGSGTTSRSGEWGQGKWGSYKPHRGYADLGNSPSNWCSGARNITVTLTMTRLSTSHGQAGAVPRPRIKEPNGNFWDSGKAFARGATHSITLPSSISSAIASGSMKTLEMWAGTSTNDYSFYNNATIKITCEKQV